MFSIFVCLGLASSLYAQARLAGSNDPSAAARPGFAEIIFNAENSAKDIAVWVNGSIAAHVRPGTREKIIVRNGQNLLEAADTTSRGGQWNISGKKQISVESSSNRVTIGLTTRYGALLTLNIENTSALSGGAGNLTPSAGSLSTASAPTGAAVPAAPFSSSSSGAAPIENAVYRAADIMIANIPPDSTLAVLSMAADESDLSDFIIEEFAYLMVESKKFKVVDRKNLDAVREEQGFQYSESMEVDDNSAVSIGKLLGATIVITGSAGGSGATRRLRVKALDVETAEIKAMASERY